VRTKRRARRSLERYKKGHLFEEVVEKYFQQLGYGVKRNVVKTGYSGARHEVDVLITKGDVVGVVEAKNYSKPIPKEWIIKAQHVAKDIGATEVYVVSAKGFTEDAEKTAEILGVKLLDLNEMAEIVRRVREESEVVEKLYVKPAFKPQEAMVLAEKFAARRLFTKVESPADAKLVHVPVYYIEGVHTYVEEEGVIIRREVERHREVRIYVSAVNGGLVVYGRDAIDAVVIPPLSDDEIELLKVLGDYEDATVDDLLEETSWSRSKLTRVLNKLVEKELVDVEERPIGEEEELTRVLDKLIEVGLDIDVEETGGRSRRRPIRVYNSVLPSIEELEETGIGLVDIDSAMRGTPDDALNSKISINHVKPLVERLYDMEVKTVRMVYLPLYKIKMEKGRTEAYRFIYLAGWIGKPLDATALVKA